MTEIKHLPGLYVIVAKVAGIIGFVPKYLVTSDNIIDFNERYNRVTMWARSPSGIIHKVSFVFDLECNETAPETFKQWLKNKRQRAKFYNF